MNPLQIVNYQNVPQLLPLPPVGTTDQHDTQKNAAATKLQSLIRRWFADEKHYMTRADLFPYFLNPLVPNYGETKHGHYNELAAEILANAIAVMQRHPKKFQGKSTSFKEHENNCYLKFGVKKTLIDLPADFYIEMSEDGNHFEITCKGRKIGKGNNKEFFNAPTLLIDRYVIEGERESKIEGKVISLRIKKDLPVKDSDSEGDTKVKDSDSEEDTRVKDSDSEEDTKVKDTKVNDSDSEEDTSHETWIRTELFNKFKDTDVKMAAPYRRMFPRTHEHNLFNVEAYGDVPEEGKWNKETWYNGDLDKIAGAEKVALTMADNTQMRAFTHKDLVDVCFDVAQSMDILHRDGFVHGDLKFANILVEAKDRQKMKGIITDFGSSGHIGCVDVEQIPHWDKCSRHTFFEHSETKEPLGLITPFTDCYSLGLYIFMALFPVDETEAMKRPISFFEGNLKDDLINNYTIDLIEESSLADNLKNTLIEYYGQDFSHDNLFQNLSYIPDGHKVSNKIKAMNIAFTMVEEIFQTNYTFFKLIRTNESIQDILADGELSEKLDCLKEIEDKYYPMHKIKENLKKMSALLS